MTDSKYKGTIKLPEYINLEQDIRTAIYLPDLPACFFFFFFFVNPIYRAEMLIYVTRSIG